MKIIETVADMEATRARMEGDVGLVPTMGYLHEGHLSLVRRCREEKDRTIVSVFVNPTQFGPDEDLDRYPRNRDRDLALLEAERVDAVFWPAADEIYPPGFNDWVEVTGPIVTRLEGAARPGHFRGVTTVVARLFRIVRPDRAYFGQKDAQQLRVIRRMVENLDLGVEIVACPTIRDPDGLAMSSRNAYLSPEERRAALVIPRALDLVRKMVLGRGVRDADLIRESVEDYVRQVPKLGLEYISVADEQTFDEVETIDRPVLVLLAARVGPTRLIDNALLSPEGVELPEGVKNGTTGRAD
jgi:pantoate--beta-alanine ligase